MARMLAFARTLAALVAVASVAVLGLALHAAAALLSFPVGGVITEEGQWGTSATSLVPPDRQWVGMRRLPAEGNGPGLTVWYPSMAPHPDAAGRLRAGVRYAYGIAALSPGTTTTLASYGGRAIPGGPADAASEPYPVVVLSPGFAIGSASYGWLAEHLASHGFVVAAVQHLESLDPTTLWMATADRPRDVSDALDRIAEEAMPSGLLAGLVDLERVGVLGHSFGGYAALAAGGAHLNTAELLEACASDGAPDGPLTLQCDGMTPYLAELAQRWGLSEVPAGAWPSRADSRVDAVVALAADAVMFGAEGLASLDVPLLAIGGTADADAPFQWGTRAAFEHASSDRKAEVSLVGAEHLVFAGGCETPRLALSLIGTPFCSDPAWGSVAAHEVIARYTTAFLRAELTGDTSARTRLGPHSEPLNPSVAYRHIGY